MPADGKTNRGRSAGPENRRALIAAAREVFAEGGFAAPLSAVARRAGVGQGSLYRHFPDRIALALAVFDDNITDLEALRDRPDARMSDLFDEISEQAIASTALIDMISTERHDPRAEELGARVSAVVDAVLVRDQDARRIRASVTGRRRDARGVDARVPALAHRPRRASGDRRAGAPHLPRGVRDRSRRERLGRASSDGYRP